MTMIRNLKILGLALGAMLAFGALSASGASAQEQGVLTGGPVTLTGEEVGADETENRLTAFGGFVDCPNSSYTGHVVKTHEETTHDETTEVVDHTGLIPADATEATLTPHYNQTNDNCFGPFGISATVDMNGCDYVVHLGDTTPAENNEGTYGVEFDVLCPPEKEITVTLWTSKEDHTDPEVDPFCDLHVPEQKGLTGAHATDEGNGHIKLEGEVEGIQITREVTPPHEPSLLCNNDSTKTGKFDLNVTVSGHDAEGKETGISLSH